MGLRVALLCCCLTLASPLNAAEWVRVETPHLIVFGPGEKRTREVTAEFERFREALSQILPSATMVSAVPTIVVAFENDTAFNAYRPTFNGKPVKLGGFYTGSESDSMIAFPVSDRENGLRIIFHEYTHLITANASRGLPAWVSEGLAEFYSTFEIRPDGKQALLGKVVPGHIQLLNATSRWLTLEQLLTVTHDSPMYNEGERRSIFYAQSWAMVHMFMTAKQSRSKELSQYVQLTSSGVPPVEAWQRAFGDFDVDKELRRYLSQFTMRGFLYKFAEGIGEVKAEATKPMPADVEAVLGRLRRYGNRDDVEPQLVRAAAMTPPSMLARALLGHTYVRGTKDEEGAALLVEAAADPSDWLVQYFVAAGIVGLQTRADDEVVAIARAAVDRVIAARPQLAHGHAMKSRLASGAEALTHARKARGLAPGREDYTFLEARAHAEVRDFPTARATLAPLLTPNYPQSVRDRARTLMGQIVRLEQFQETSRATPPATPAAPPTSRAPDDPVRLPTGTQWEFRKLQAGEQRVEGLLVRIDCTRTGAVTLVVRVNDAIQRFAAPKFGDIDFITYREQKGGSISCGERKPADLVYVTWIPAATPVQGIAGRPVAVEFLPERR